MFQMMKVFDCQRMPKEERHALFDSFQKSNDSCVQFQIGEDYGPQLKLVEDWLIGQGAEDGEEVIILYWW